MAGMNSVNLVGRVGQDPDFRQFPNGGGSVIEFSLATSETWRDKHSGEKKEKTQWHRIKILNENVIKIARDYVKKGDLVGIEGTLEYRQWEKDGQKHTMAEIVVGMFNGKLHLLGSSGDGEGRSGGSSRRDDDRGSRGYDRGRDDRGGSSKASRPAPDYDDDIPF